MSKAKDIIHECGYMQIGKVSIRSEHMEQPWTKPPHGMIKCNVDASSLNVNSIMGYNMCFRDSICLFLLGKSDYFALFTTVLKVENLGLPEAIKVAISNGIQDFMFETNFKVLSDALDTTSTLSNESLTFQGTALVYRML